MINLNNLESTQNKTVVVPSDNIFSELGKNTYDYKDILSELIDNSLAARILGKLLNVEIELITDQNGNPIELYFRDDASGIPEEILGKAISPAGIKTSNSLNEHGLGMKQAIAALGKLRYLATKTSGEQKARVIKEFRFGNLETFVVDFGSESGTEICVHALNQIVISHATTITKSLVPYLGARYRKFLKATNPDLKLIIKLRRKNQAQVDSIWNVEEVKPIYFHPSTRTNKPVINNFEISGHNWKASLTFGYAPKDKEEYEELGIEQPNKFHPYNVTLSKQGLDIILHNRVILFHQLSEISLVSSKHNDYNVIRGEISLISGFSTAITKNSIIHDKNFQECIVKIANILSGDDEGPEDQKKNYLKTKTYPEAIPEALLRDRLQNWLSTNPLQRKQQVLTEYVVDGIEGFIDILADNEAWELKVEGASAFEVYQLFMYMDVKGLKKGYLVAKEFTTGAKVASDFIKENHNKEILLCNLKDFPINHHPNSNEREEYY